MPLTFGHDEEHQTFLIGDHAFEACPRPARTDTFSQDSVDDVVDVWGKDSFPASDPPSNW